tara:strand:- start:2538 stop:3842 length:1305 start_codon:yes stop_codon:yes gene_type:complete
MSYIEKRCKNCAQYDSTSFSGIQTQKHCLRDYPRTSTKENCKIRFRRKGKWYDAFIPNRILLEDIPINYFNKKEWQAMDKKEKLEALDALMKQQVKKAAKKGAELIVGTVDDLPESFRTIQQQPLGFPLFDSWCNGGLPKGGTVTFTGAPSVGKTSTALMLTAAYQRQNKVVMFVNYEGTFDEKWATKLGVNVAELYLVHPETLEDGLIAIEEAAKEGILDAVVFDSLDAATARGTLHKKGSQGKPGISRDLDDDTIALKPRQLSQWFPRVQLSFRKYATTLIIIAQQRIQMSGIMAYQGMSGGNALKHSNILNLTMTRKNNKNDLIINGESVAYEMGLKVTKSKYSGLKESDVLDTFFFHKCGFNKGFEYVSMGLSGELEDSPLTTTGTSTTYINSDGESISLRGAKPGTIYSKMVEKNLLEDYIKQLEVNEN